MTSHASVPPHALVRGCYALQIALALVAIAVLGAVRPGPSAPASSPQQYPAPTLTVETCDAPAFGEPAVQPSQPLRLTC
ncbi:hypothetical protein [Leptolyngbya sp. KIOST-1]|uniref:hypothetical protein n=1 Tax=Leptolyngbya sp. KIOST-1 TaxID=1229172 RepID=UPI000A78370F|nr:hypothetical protein [Leptolyngbya sp. KIOST-1]